MVALRRNIFFRQTTEGTWLRTYPQAEFWGESHSLDTAHLTFTYNEIDAAMVDAVAPRVEEALLVVYGLLDVDPPSTADKIPIEVLMQWPQDGNNPGRPIKVVSTVVTDIPIADSAEDTFMRQISYQLVEIAIADFLPSNERRSPLWQAILFGIRSWLEEGIVEQPAFWRDRPRTLLQQKIDDGMTITLADFNMITSSNVPPAEWMWRLEAGTSLLNFIEAEYGTAEIPVFLRALAEHSEWAELIDVRYDMPITAFETQWNHYISKEYATP